jgi:hypothetical protein
MISISRMVSAALLVGVAFSVAAPVQALPIAAPLQLSDASTPGVQTVQWRRGGWAADTGGTEGGGAGVVWALGLLPGR